MIEAAFLALAAGCALLCGGTIHNLARTPFRYLAFLFVAAVLDPIVRFLPLVEPLAYFLTVLKYALLVAAILVNRQFLPLTALALPGTLLNALVILINNGRMPVQLPNSVATEGGARAAALSAGEMGGYILQSDKTLLPFLGDVIHLYAFGQWMFVSIGDILLVAGAFLFLCRAMRGDYMPSEPKKVRAIRRSDMVQ